MKGLGKLAIFELLNGNNYEDWRDNIDTLLQRHACVPEDEPDAQAEAEVLRKYRANNAKALGIIKIHLDPKLKKRARKYTSAKKLLDDLAAKFDNPQSRSVLLPTLTAKLSSRKKESSESMAGYLEDYTDIFEKIENLNIVETRTVEGDDKQVQWWLPDCFRKSYILNGLKDSKYQALKQIFTVNNTSLEQVEAELLKNDRTTAFDGLSDDDEDEALTINHHEGRPNKFRGKVCSHCGFEDHIASLCPRRLKGIIRELGGDPNKYLNNDNNNYRNNYNNNNENNYRNNYNNRNRNNDSNNNNNSRSNNRNRNNNDNRSDNNNKQQNNNQRSDRRNRKQKERDYSDEENGIYWLDDDLDYTLLVEDFTDDEDYDQTYQSCTTDSDSDTDPDSDFEFDEPDIIYFEPLDSSELDSNSHHHRFSSDDLDLELSVTDLDLDSDEETDDSDNDDFGIDPEAFEDFGSDAPKLYLGALLDKTQPAETSFDEEEDKPEEDEQSQPDQSSDTTPSPLKDQPCRPEIISAKAKRNLRRRRARQNRKIRLKKMKKFNNIRLRLTRIYNNLRKFRQIKNRFRHRTLYFVSPKKLAKQYQLEKKNLQNYIQEILTTDQNHRRRRDYHWILDSGATIHTTFQKHLLRNYKPTTGQVRTAKGGGNINIVGTGDILMQIGNKQGDTKTILLKDVKYIPSVTRNLISVKRLQEKNVETTFKASGEVDLKKDGDLIGQAFIQDGLPTLNCKPIPFVIEEANLLSEATILTWHQRLGHINTNYVKKLSKRVDGMKIKDSPTEFVCKGCQLGKMRRKKFHRTSQRQPSKKLLPGNKLHSDIAGPITPESRTKCKYFGSLIDDTTRYSFILNLKKKSDLTNELINKVRYIEKQLERPVKVLRSDNGGEYKSSRLKLFKEKKGIKSEFTIPYTPQINGVAERYNQVIMNTVRAILAETGLPKFLWLELANTANYLRNITPTVSLSKATPYELWYGHKPNLSHLRRIGCTAYYKDNHNKKKLQNKARVGYLVGYQDDTSSYRIYDKKLNKVIIARDVVFDEDRVYNSEEPPDPSKLIIAKKKNTLLEEINKDHSLDYGDESTSESDNPALPPPQNNPDSSSSDQEGNNQTVQVDNSRDTSVPLDSQSDSYGSSDDDSQNPPADAMIEEPTPSDYLPFNNFFDLEEEPSDDQQDDPEPSDDQQDNPEPSYQQQEPSDDQQDVLVESKKDRLLRITKERMLDGPSSASRPRRAAAAYHLDFAFLLEEDELEHVLTMSKVNQHFEPKTYKQAVTCKDKEKWTQAMIDEINSLRQMNTYRLTKLPKGRKPIACKWVYRIKLDADGNVDKYKARLVCKGFSETEGVDYDIFGTFSPVAKLPSLRLLLAIAVEYKLVLRHGDFKNAFVQKELDKEIYMTQPEGFEEVDSADLVWLLIKSLYGLKQAPRLWNNKIKELMTSLGFTATRSDPCIFVRITEDNRIYILVYVDDLIIAAKNHKIIDHIVKQIQKTLMFEDLGPLNWYLNMKIEQDISNNTVTISQTQYIDKILTRFEMTNCKPLTTPLGTFKLTAEQCPQSEREKLEMRNKPYRELIGSLIYLAQGTRPDIMMAVSTLSKFFNNPGIEHWKAAKRLLKYLKRTKDLKLTFCKTKNPLIGYADASHAMDPDSRRGQCGYVFLWNGAPITWKSQATPQVSLSTMESEFYAVVEATKEAMWLSMILKEMQVPVPETLTINEDNEACIKFCHDPKYHARAKHIDIRYHFVREKIEEKKIDLKYCRTERQLADILTKPLNRNRHQLLTQLLGLRE